MVCLRRFSDIYIPLRKLSLTQRMLQRAILRFLKNFGQATRLTVRKIIISMLVLLFRFLSTFPLPLLHGMGAAAGWLVYLLSPSYRRRMRANMTQAGFARHLSAAVAESGKS